MAKEGGVKIPVAQPWLGDRYFSEMSPFPFWQGLLSEFSVQHLQHRSPSPPRLLSVPRAAALSQAREALLFPGVLPPRPYGPAAAGHRGPLARQPEERLGRGPGMGPADAASLPLPWPGPPRCRGAGGINQDNEATACHAPRGH